MPVTGPRTETERARGSLLGRIASVWRHLPGDRRLAAVAAIGLLLTLFLPWYQESVIVSARTRPVTATLSVTGWGAFSFVEAAVMLVAICVLVLLFQRGEGRAFHLPGGDGLAITVAGGWTCFLIAWRMLDKQGTAGHSQYASSSGIEWGIFVALAVAGVLTYAGTRIRISHRPEPPLPGEDGVVFDGQWQTSARGARGPARRAQGGSGSAPGTRQGVALTEPTAADGDAEPTVSRTQPAAADTEPTVSRTEPAIAPSQPAVARTEPTIARTARATSSRSSWRPADHPEWSEPEPRGDWLAGGRAAAAHTGARIPAESESGAAPTASFGTAGVVDADGEQLTIPLDEEH
jgi:hypothetical protein